MVRGLDPAWDDTSGAHLAEALTRPDDEYWQSLEDVLSHGGTFTTTRGKVRGRREFCAPYVYSAYPELPDSALDPSYPWAILGGAVAVRIAPDAKANIIRRLSFELVQASGAVGDGNWIGVELADGREGFVDKKEIRNPGDFHGCFAEISGTWYLVIFDRQMPDREGMAR